MNAGTDIEFLLTASRKELEKARRCAEWSKEAIARKERRNTHEYRRVEYIRRVNQRLQEKSLNECFDLRRFVASMHRPSVEKFKPEWDGEKFY